MTLIFAELAPIYQGRGFWPRPITLRSKACHQSGWQTPDPYLPAGQIDKWIESCPHFGVGLLMGSPCPEGTTLGALDIDRDEYVGIGRALLSNPPCARIGKKGVVYFVRVRGKLTNPEFRPKGSEHKGLGKVAECLFTAKICVIPPTIHPETNAAYRWIGQPLHEIDLGLLPIVEM